MLHYLLLAIFLKSLLAQSPLQLLSLNGTIQQIFVLLNTQNTLIGNQLGQQTIQQNVTFNKAFPQIPTLIFWLFGIKDTQLDSTEISLSLVPGTLTTLGFTLQITKYGQSQIQYLQINGLASISNKLYLGSIDAQVKAANGKISVIFPISFGTLPTGICGFSAFHLVGHPQSVSVNLSSVSNTQATINLYGYTNNNPLVVVFIFVDSSPYLDLSQIIVEKGIFNFGPLSNPIQLQSSYMNYLNPNTSLIFQTNLFMNFVTSFSSINSFIMDNVISNNSMSNNISQVMFPYQVNSYSNNMQYVYEFMNLAYIQGCQVYSTLILNQCVCNYGYLQTNINICAQCTFPCVQCQTSITNCSSCDLMNNWILILNNNSCLCKTGYQINPLNISNCMVVGINNSLSLVNQTTLVIQSLLINNTTLNGTTQLICEQQCKNCSQNSSTQCTSCFDGYYLDSFQCKQCDLSCQTCRGSSLVDCMTCAQNRSFQQNQCLCDSGAETQFQVCIVQCPLNQFSFNSKCQQCHPLCAKCNGFTENDCNTSIQSKIFLMTIESQLNYSIFANNGLQLIGRNSYLQSGSQNSTYLNESILYRWSVLENNTEVIFLQGITQTNQQLYFTIPCNTLQNNKQYEIILKGNIQDSISSADQNQEQLGFQTIKNNYYGYILYGNSTNSYTSDIFIELKLYDSTLTPSLLDWNHYTIEWSFSNIISHATQLGLLKNNSNIQKFKPYTFEYDQIYELEVNIVELNLTIFTFLTIIQESLPQLGYILGDPSILYRRINPQERIRVFLQYSSQSNYDNLYYSVIFNYNNTKNLQKFDYIDIEFKLVDIYNNFSLSTGTLVQIKFNIFDQKYTIPSQATLLLNINIPPQFCQLLVQPLQGVEMDTTFNIQIQNCFDDDSPLQYTYFISQNAVDTLNYDNNQKIIIINDLSRIPTFSTQLPRLQDTIFIIVKVIDSYGAETILEQAVSLKSNQQFQINPLTNLFPDLKNLNLILLAKQLNQKDLVQLQNNQILNTQSILYDQVQHNLFNQLIQKTHDISLLNNYFGILQDQIQKLFTMKTNLLFIQQSSYSYQWNCQLDQNQQNMLSSLKTLDVIKDQNQMNQVFDRGQTNQYGSQTQRQSDKLNQRILKIIYNLTQSYLLGNLPNSNQFFYQSSSMKINAQYLSQKKIKKFLGSNISLKLSKRYPNQTSIYIVLKRIYYDNPLKFNSSMELTGNQVMFDLNIQHYENKSDVQVSNKITYRMQSLGSRLLFNKEELQQNIKSSSSINNSPGQTTTCLSFDNTNWGTTNCQTITQNNQTYCQCKDISITTTVDDFKLMIDQGLSEKQVFTSDTLIRMGKFSWQSATLTYLIGSITILCITVSIWGFFRDQQDMKVEVTRIHPLKEADYKFKKVEDSEQREEQVILSAKGLSSQVRIFSRSLKNKLSTKNPKTAFITKDSSVMLVIDQVNKKDEQNMSSFQLTQDKETQTTFTEPVPENKKNRFLTYLKKNHPITNVVLIYEKDSSRMRRSLEIYTASLLDLTITLIFGYVLVYFQKKFISLLRVLTLTVIAYILNFVVSTLLKKSFESNYSLIRYFGSVLILGLNGLMIYSCFGIMAQNQSEELANIWTIQFSVNFINSNFIYQVIDIALRYVLVNMYKQGSTNIIISCVLLCFFNNQNLITT